jgi:hypothetical protein
LQRKDAAPQVVSSEPAASDIAFNIVEPKETDPCNILPPLADWR